MARARGKRRGNRHDDDSDDSQTLPPGDQDRETKKRLVRLRKVLTHVTKLRREETTDDQNHIVIITRVNKIIRRLNKLHKKFHKEDDSEETKPHKLSINNKILRYLNLKLKLLQELKQQEVEAKKKLTKKIRSRVWKLLDVEAYKMRALGQHVRDAFGYDRDSPNSYTPEEVKSLLSFANLAIDFFNETSPIIYSVVEVVCANRYFVAAGIMLNLTFIAQHDVEYPKTFKARICYGINKPLVKFVAVVLYDRDSADSYTPEDVKSLMSFANLSIDFFNETSSIIYSVVELVYATEFLAAGTMLNLTFIAQHDVDDPKTFKAAICQGSNKPPQVKFVTEV